MGGRILGEARHAVDTALTFLECVPHRLAPNLCLTHAFLPPSIALDPPGLSGVWKRRPSARDEVRRECEKRLGLAEMSLDAQKDEVPPFKRSRESRRQARCFHEYLNVFG